MDQNQPLILIIGGADTGRAPMAVALLRRLLSRRGLPWSVESAGVVGHDDAPAEPEARDAMAALGLDIGAHRARSLTDDLAADAAALLAVDRGVARVLRGRYPEATVAALSELAASRRDVPDPFRMQVGAWLLYAQEIEAMVRAGLPRLVALVEGGAPAEAIGDPIDNGRGGAGEGLPAGSGGGAAHAAAPTAESPAAVTLHPARASALDRAERLLRLLREAPGAIDWPGARRQLAADLAAAAAHPFGPADLAAPYAAVVEAMLGLSPAAPSPAQADALRAALARLRGPVATADLSALSASLPGYAALA